MGNVERAEALRDVVVASSESHVNLLHRVDALRQEAERNSRSGSLDYDERTRWRRFAAQLSEALK